MKIPNSVRIGGIDYKIEKIDRLIVDGKYCWGLCEHAQSKITLDSETEHQRQCVTLLHEIIHAICHQANTKLSDEDEENVCIALSQGIYQVLQDNINQFFDDNKNKIMGNDGV